MNEGESKMVKVTLLGTASPIPDPERAQSSYVITVDGQHYLFDIGHGATRRLIEANIDPSTVNHIFLSHLHSDHTVDLPYFLITTWMDNREVTPAIYGPRQTDVFVESLLEQGAYRTDIAVRVSKANDNADSPKKNIERLRPEVTIIEPGLIFEDHHIRVFADYAVHIISDLTECFGFRIETKREGKVIVYSGDTAPTDSILKLAQDCDLLIHECTFPTKATVFKERLENFHTNPIELGEIAQKANVKSLVATHLTNFQTTNPIVKKHVGQYIPSEYLGPHLLDEIVDEIRLNYQGPLRIAHDLMRIDL